MRYVWHEGKWTDPAEIPVEAENYSDFPTPIIMKSMNEYLSPIDNSLIDMRYKRTEDLKRNDCREVDPSEFKPTYIDKRYAEKHGKPWDEEGAAKEDARRAQIMRDRKAHEAPDVR